MTAAPSSQRVPGVDASGYGGDLCVDGHEYDAGICRKCGVWLSEAICRDPDCDWVWPHDPSTLEASVVHHAETHHSVRVCLG